jgi:hypothetical protein
LLDRPSLGKFKISLNHGLTAKTESFSLHCLVGDHDAVPIVKNQNVPVASITPRVAAELRQAAASIMGARFRVW